MVDVFTRTRCQLWRITRRSLNIKNRMTAKRSWPQGNFRIDDQKQDQNDHDIEAITTPAQYRW
jgi:hypothetical protein